LKIELKLDHHSVDNHNLLLSYGPTITAINNCAVACNC